MIMRLLMLFGLRLTVALAVCPDEDSNLVLFSTSPLATDLTKSSNIDITSSILLDQNLDVGYITVSGSGKLVFKRGQDIEVKTLGIMVKDTASLIIGSDDCRHEDNVNIILQGQRNPNLHHGHEGQKYIAVKDEGTLHIYGKDKLHWTKLAATAERFYKDPSNVIFEHITSRYASIPNDDSGLALYIFDTMAAEVKHFVGYDIWRDGLADNGTYQINRMINALDGIQNGDVFAIVVQNVFKARPNTDLDPLFAKIEEVAKLSSGELLLRNCEQHDAFSMVYVKNDDLRNFGHQAVDYMIAKDEAKATASVIIQDITVTAESYIDFASPQESSIAVRVLKKAVGRPSIEVIDDISSWSEGDEILLTSTDYNYKHAEVRKIISKPTPTSIQLSGELIYRHHGEEENRVDMRGEVALLTRNIKIQGEMSRGCPAGNGNCDKVNYDTFGGHIKVLHGFRSIAIEGAELQFMGQPTQMGFYPIHFHMCLNVTGKLALVKRNSIWNTFQRAVTVHGTYGTDQNNLGVEVIENVAFNVLGHAFFLEDGIEIATKLHGNLGANVKNIRNHFDTDGDRATVFWITNPKVILKGNVAAGADGFGYWYVFPLSPVGASANSSVYAKYEAQYTPLWTCDNNVAHSNFRGGFNFDNVLEDGFGKVGSCVQYKPVENPLDPSSPDVKVQITRLTAYKNENINTWIRGGYIELMQYSAAESKRGIMLTRGAFGRAFVKKSVIMGKSTTNFEDVGYYGAKMMPHYVGIVLYDGPVFVSDTAFFGFDNAADGSHVSGAIGFTRKNIAASTTETTVSGIRFGFSDKTDGNRVLFRDINDEDLGFCNFQDDTVSTFRDSDGSVTSCPGETFSGVTQIVKPEKFLITDRCKYRENWQKMSCHDQYGRLRTEITSVFYGDIHTFPDGGQMRRVRFDNPSIVDYEHHLNGMIPEYTVILGPHSREFYYEFQFSNTTTFVKKVRLIGKAVQKDQGVVIGICLPEGATADNVTITASTGAAGVTYEGTDLVAVNSVDEVSSSDVMNSYYRNGRLLYLKLDTWLQRNTHWDKLDTGNCPSGQCPYVELEFDQEFSYTPCFNPTDEELKSDLSLSDLSDLGIENITCEFPASSPAYEQDWGAGTFNAPVDGAYGEWSSWSDCCADWSFSKTRYRVCDTPPPYGTGTTCSGPNTETQPCDCP